MVRTLQPANFVCLEEMSLNQLAIILVAALSGLIYSKTSLTSQ